MSLVKCPKCQAEVSSLTRSCPACGAALPETPSVPSPAVTVTCPNPQCKAKISPLALACPSCGLPLENFNLTPARSTRGKGPTGFFWTYFWGIITHPVATFEDILEGPPHQHIWKVLFIVTFFGSLEETVKKGELWHILLFPLSALFAWLFAWFGAWIVTTVGSWMGGQGSVPEIFDYVVWAEIPGLAGVILEIIRNFSDMELWRLGWGALELAAVIWAFVVSLLLLASAHRYSVGMALLTDIVAFVLVLLVIGLPLYILALVIGGLAP